MTEDWEEEFNEFFGEEEEIPEAELIDDDEEFIEGIAEMSVRNPSMTPLDIAVAMGLCDSEVKSILYRKETRRLIKNIKYSYTDDLNDARNASVNLLKRIVENKDGIFNIKDRINVAKFVASSVVKSQEEGEEDELVFVTTISKTTGALTRETKKFKEGKEI